MQLGVITESDDLYSEVTNVTLQLDHNFDINQMSSLDDVKRVINEEQPELMFIDTGFEEANFTALTRMIRKNSPHTGMIIIADNEKYAVPAYEVHATGYIIKPVTDVRLKEELVYYTSQFADKRKDPAAIQVMTDGNFEVFLNGTPARFKYSKTKKLLEHIISQKGAMVGNDELIRALWNIDMKNLSKSEQKSRSSYLRNLEADLMKVLTGAGCEDAVIKHWGEIAAAMDKITFID